MLSIDNIAPEHAEDALARLAVHVPHDVRMPRMLAAHTADDENEPGVVFVGEDGSFWWSHAGRALRLVHVSATHVELTEWGWRMERLRTVERVEDAA